MIRAGAEINSGARYRARTGDPWGLILLDAVGLALAMLVPGAWSIDALVFGRRRMIL